MYAHRCCPVNSAGDEACNVTTRQRKGRPRSAPGSCGSAGMRLQIREPVVSDSDEEPRPAGGAAATGTSIGHDLRGAQPEAAPTAFAAL